jgi:hypothetical protein
MLQHFWVWVLNLTPHAGHALCLMHSARRSQSRKATTNGGFHWPSEECKGLSVSVIHYITSPVSCDGPWQRAGPGCCPSCPTPSKTTILTISFYWPGVPDHQFWSRRNLEIATQDWAMSGVCPHCRHCRPSPLVWLHFLCNVVPFSTMIRNMLPHFFS